MIGTQADVFYHLSEVHKIPKTQVAAIFESLADLARSCLQTEDGTVVIPGIGKIKRAVRNARIARNPKTGERVEVPAKVVLKFKAAKELRDAVK